MTWRFHCIFSKITYVCWLIILGTLRTFPLLKEATAYWYLRPFLPDVERDVFPGCYPGKTFHISNKYHPAIHDFLVSAPDMGPGDTIWWHADLVSIDTSSTWHQGKQILFHYLKWTLFLV